MPPTIGDNETPEEGQWSVSLAKKIMPEHLQQAHPLLLQTKAGSAILSAPCLVMHHCLPPAHFCITICQRLCIPIYRKQRKCCCGKLIDIYGDHYFECSRLSKTWLNNKCHNINVKWLERMIVLASLVLSTAAVHAETSSISAQVPGICPLDFSVQTITGIKGINVTITGMPKLAKSP
eukprot:1980886-Ditylum_brightwellii.AAC.1